MRFFYNVKEQHFVNIHSQCNGWCHGDNHVMEVLTRPEDTAANLLDYETHLYALFGYRVLHIREAREADLQQWQHEKVWCHSINTTQTAMWLVWITPIV